MASQRLAALQRHSAQKRRESSLSADRTIKVSHSDSILPGESFDHALFVMSCPLHRIRGDADAQRNVCSACHDVCFAMHGYPSWIPAFLRECRCCGNVDVAGVFLFCAATIRVRV
jgi:hypothetical protein